MKYQRLRILKKVIIVFFTLFQLPRPISRFDFRRLPTHFAKTGHILCTIKIKQFSFILGISAQLAIFEFVKYTHGLIYHRNYVGGHTVNYGPSSCFVIFSLKSFLDRKQVTILNNVASAPRKVIAAWLGIIVKYVEDNCIV